MTEKNNKDFTRLMGLRVKPENDIRGETGRSMVEILGVLAIVGVLSVGSIWGLKQAFDKNNANEITYELSQRAIIISAIKEGKSEATLDAFNDSEFTKKYNITYNNDEEEGFFSITMENVPNEVIEQLKQMGWDLPYNVYINNVHIDDYNPATKEQKESFLKSVFIKSAMAAGNGNKIKFVFNNKLDKNVKPSYINEKACINTSGSWDGERCFCPQGSVMTPTGCFTDRDAEYPKETICYRDEECRGCLEICSNGKCVVDKNHKANGVPYCEGTKIITSVMSGSKDTTCATNTETKDCAVYGVDMTCAEENGEAKCVHKAECSRDADCLGCFEVCTDGKCVIDEAELSYCMGTKLMTLTQITGDKENGCFVEPEEQDCTVHGPEFTCSEESGTAQCIEQAGTPCSTDEDCGCYEICSNGVCVVDDTPHCNGTKVIILVPNEKGSCLAWNKVIEDCSVHGPEFTCSEENGEAQCIEQAGTPCSTDEDCGCYEICSNGVCVVDDTPHCNGTKVIILVPNEKGSCLAWNKVIEDCSVHGPEFTCSEESGTAQCIEQAGTPCSTDGDCGCYEICSNGVCVVDDTPHCNGTKVIISVPNEKGSCLAWNKVIEDCSERGVYFTCSEENGEAQCIEQTGTPCSTDGDCGCYEICSNGVCVVDDTPYCHGTEIVIAVPNEKGSCLAWEKVIEDCSERGIYFTCSEESGTAQCIETDTPILTPERVAEWRNSNAD